MFYLISGHWKVLVIFWSVVLVAALVTYILEKSR